MDDGGMLQLFIGPPGPIIPGPGGPPIMPGPGPIIGLGPGIMPGPLGCLIP